MHSEHLNNVHPGWVVGGWALAILGTLAVVALGGALFASAQNSMFLLGLGVVVGFSAAGLMIGLRWADAPILHAGAITMLSVVVSFGGSVLLPSRLGGGSLGLERPEELAGLILLQFASAAVGARFGRRLVRTGEEPGVLA
jgi:hypothetical protein